MPPVVRYVTLPAFGGFDALDFTTLAVMPPGDDLPEVPVLMGKRRAMAAAAFPVRFGRVAVPGD